jgi:hypothetical protein
MSMQSAQAQAGCRLLGAAPAGASGPSGAVRNVRASQYPTFSQPLQFARNPTNGRNLIIISHDQGQTWQDYPIVQTASLYDNVVAGTLGVAADGTVYGAWYRCQDGAYGFCNVDSREQLSVSHDGGQTFPNEPLATAPSTPEVQGHYIGGPLIMLGAVGAEVAWMDDRTGADQTEVGIVPLR